MYGHDIVAINVYHKNMKSKITNNITIYGCYV